jgi:hypothetical protein
MVGLAVLFAAALAADAVASLEIRGETTCPDPEAVRSQLRPLAPGPWPSEDAVKVVVLGDAKGDDKNRGALVVTLFGPGLELLEERRLAPYASCEERARAAAVVIAAWLTSLPVGATAAMRLAGAPVPTADFGVATQTQATAPPSPLLFRGTAAALVSVTPDGTAPGLLIEAAMLSRQGRWALSVAGLYTGRHRKSVGMGEGIWRRWGGAAGGSWQAVRRRLWLDLRGELLVTRLDIVGRGFPTNTGGTTWDLGAAAGMRLGYGRGHVQPWLGAWAVGWAGTQNVHVSGAAERQEIPRVEALLGAGATFGGRRETF